MSTKSLKSAKALDALVHHVKANTEPVSTGQPHAVATPPDPTGEIHAERAATQAADAPTPQTFVAAAAPANTTAPVSPSTKRKPKDPRRLLGARVDDQFAAEFDQFRQVIQIQLGNPSLSVQDLVDVIIRSTLAKGEAGIAELLPAIKQQQVEKARGRLS